MSLAATVKAMAAAGFSAQQIDDVVSRMDEQRRAKTRAGNARRQAEFRARHNASNTVNAVTGVTTVTEPSSLLPSSTPPTNNSSPQPSLRSDLDRARETFERFFEIFPKRINRKDAFVRWKTALKAGVDPERIIAAAIRYAEHMRFTDPQFIKAPDAWLNAGKYDDELPVEPPKPSARAGPNGNKPLTFAEMARMEFTDEPRPNPPDKPKPTSSDDSTVIGFAGRLSQPDRDHACGQLLDLGSVDARWRA